MSISRKRMFGQKIGVVILAVLMVLGMVPGLLAPGGGKAYAAEDTYTGEGAGTMEDPYLIATADQLNEVRDHLDAHFKLIADIDMDELLDSWEPIASGIVGSSYFQGSMDGNGYKIKNLENYPYVPNKGLFGIIGDSAVITNMKLEDVSVSGSSYVGGLVGYNKGGTISNSYVKGKITGDGNSVGGLVGLNEGEISNSYAAVNVTSNLLYIGGLVGQNSGGTISNSYATGKVTGGSGAYYIGGLIGDQSGTVSNSYATGEVTGASGVDYIGGLVGINSGGTISNSYATGKVTGGRNYIGGLVGYQIGTISNSYATGEVTGDNTGTDIGGLVGGIQAGETYIDGLYDSDTTGQTDTGKGEGKSTEEMRTQTTFTDWDFEHIWAIDPSINDGYPYLQERHVTYEGNGNTSGAVVDDTAYLPDGEVTVFGSGNLVRTGYSFAGWDTAEDGSGDRYQAGDSMTLEGDDVTLYAQWTINSYTVTYDGNSSDDGTVPDAVKQNYNTTVTVAGNPGGLTRTGYTFAGWNTAADGTGTSYVTDDTFQLGANDVTLYVCWTINQYKVTYSGNDSDGGSVPDAVYHDYHTTVTVAGNPGNLTRTGHTFTGWNTAADGTGTSYWPGSTFVLGTNDVALYAQWYVNSYTVNFISNGGSVVGDVQADYGTKIAAPDTPEREGYTFTGWYKEAGFVNEWDFDADPVPVHGITLYAQWTVNSYTVTYDDNGSDEGDVPDAVTQDYNTTVTVADNTGSLTREGYAFAGWNTTADGNGTSYAAGAAFDMGAMNMTLYAQWFSTDAQLSDLAVDQGILTPAFKASELAYRVDVANRVTSLHFTFAKGDPNQSFTVTGADYQSVTGDVYGYSASNLIAGPNTIQIAVFAQDGTTQNIYNLTVNRALAYIITYDGNGATSGNAPTDGESYEQGAAIPVSGNTGNLAKQGYNFAGWNMAANGSGTSYVAGDTFNMGTANVTLYAKWASSDAMLGGLSVSSGTLNFISSKLNYTVDVDNEVNKIDISITKGDPNQTLKVTGSAYQTVTDSVYHYGASNLAVGANLIQIQVSAQDGITTKEYSITVTRAAAPSSGGDGGGGPAGGTDATNPTHPTEQNETDLNVTIDGGPGQPIATATTSEQDGQTVLTVAVDAAKLTEQLEQVGNKPVVTIPVTTSADKVIAALTGDAVEAMENKNAVLDIQTPIGSYKLPASEIRVDLLAVMLRGQGRESDIAVHVDIARSDEAKVGLLWDAANSGRFTIVAPPIDFTVTATLGDKSVTIDTFSSYVEREIPIPDGVDASKITAAVALSKDGTTRSVSMKIVTRDGKSYAVINSLTNSTYALVSHQTTFSDIANHWAKKAINEMGSRLVISGTSDSLFSPDRDITRAEFAAIIVRGLGLKPENGISAFSDVEAGAWYSSVVNTAYEYRLINGFGDGMFRPNNKITREQAMVMIAKAMEITKLEGMTSEQSAMNVLRPFTDAKEVSSWAMDGAADSVQAGIVSGRDSNNLDPKRFITRAEVAIIIQRLLEKSDLI